MRTRFVPLAASVLLLAAVLVSRMDRAGAQGRAAQNVAELGRVFAAHFVDAQKGFALADLVSDQPRVNMVKTTDGGRTWQILWTFVREADLEGIWMISDRDGVVSASNRFFFTSTGGTRWGRARTPYEMSKMRFVGDVGYAIGMPPIKRGTEGPTLLRSKNKGRQWSPVIEQPASVIDYCFVNADRGWVVDDAGLRQTLDGGRTWELKKEATGLTAVACHGERYVWAAGNGKVLQTFNNAVNWFEHDLGTRAMITHLAFLDPSNGWAYGQRELRRTVDGGINWQVLNAPPGPPQFFDLSNGWALHPNGDIFRTGDGGRTWTQQERVTNARTDAAVDIDAAIGDD